VKGNIATGSTLCSSKVGFSESCVGSWECAYKAGEFRKKREGWQYMASQQNSCELNTDPCKLLVELFARLGKLALLGTMTLLNLLQFTFQFLLHTTETEEESCYK